MRRITEDTSDSFIENARKFIHKKISEREFVYSDDLIRKVVRNGNGYNIIIEFKNDEDFFKKIFDVDGDDSWYLSVSWSPDYDFVTTETTIEDFKENGSGLFYFFNDNNVNLLKKISLFIYPGEKFDLDVDIYQQNLAKRLYEMFEDETTNMLYEINNLLNRRAHDEVKNEIREEIQKEFNPIGFELYSEFDAISIPLSVLISQMRSDRYNGSLSEYLENNPFDIGNPFYNWGEGLYEYYYNATISEDDKKQLNNDFEWELEKILNQLEDDEEYSTIGEYYKIIENLEKIAEFHFWHTLPKDNEIKFKINGVEFPSNMISVSLEQKGGSKSKTIKVSEENFYHLLYQPELFDLFEI